MLPFLKPKNVAQAGVIMKYRAPDAESGDEIDESSGEGDGLETAASDLHKAINIGDVKAIASALKAAYDICESMPSEDESPDQEMES